MSFDTCLGEKLDHLSREMRQEVERVLKGYKDVFSHCESQLLGCTLAVKHIIKTGDAAPIYKTAYRIPFGQKPVLDKLIQD